MASAGPNSPGSTSNVDFESGFAWAYDSDAKTSNNDYATASGTSNNNTDYLKATNFGFGIDAGTTIVGIKVEVELKASFADQVYDYSIRLVKGGTISGDNKARSSATKWSTSDTYITYGGETDLWGLSFTPSDINASDFGVAISAWTPVYFSASIDHVRITVYYTESTAYTKDLNDTITLSESITKKPNCLKADTVNLGDARVQSARKVFGDTVNLTDGFARVVVYVLGMTDTITLSDGVARVVAYIRACADNLTLTDEITKAPQKVLADALALTDVLVSKIFTYNRTIDDTLTLSDTISKNPQVVIADTVELTDTRVNAIDVVYADTITLTDAQFRAFGLTLSDILTLTDVLTLLNTIADSTGTYSWMKHVDLVVESWGSTDPSDIWTERTSADKTWTNR